MFGRERVTRIRTILIEIYENDLVKNVDRNTRITGRKTKRTKKVKVEIGKKGIKL